MGTPHLPNEGLDRYTMQRVVFARPFTLGKAPEVYPAGVYDIETKELPLQAGSHTAHVRTSIFLIIPTSSGTRSREVQGSELDDAVLRDAEYMARAEPSCTPTGDNAEVAPLAGPAPAIADHRTR